MSGNKLVPPCSYQGGKQRLAKKIVDIILEQNEIDDDTKFYDLCCGSGAITLELINRGVFPGNIIMCDLSPWGVFWEKVGDGTFSDEVFKIYIDDIPKDITKIKEYMQKMIKLQANDGLLDNMVYKFLILQACAFGSTATWVENNTWKKAGGLRNYWLPTESSNRKTPVNPMMPMPNTLFERVELILANCDGIKGFCCDANDIKIENNSIVYIDAPYKGTQEYGFNFDYIEYINKYKDISKIYVSEGYPIDGATNNILISKGRSKGNINGKIKKKPIEEWLNIFAK